MCCRLISAVPRCDCSAMATQKYYAVTSGKKTGVYSSWDECKKQLDGVTSPQFKIFTEEDEAYAHLYSQSTASGKKSGAPSGKPSRREVLKAMEKKHYAVAVGVKPGVYFTWKEAQEQIVGRTDAKYKCFGTMEEAEAYIVEIQSKISGKKTTKPAAKGSKFYAVKAGVKPGVYTTWAECQKNVMGFKNAEYKSFATEEEAIKFVGKEEVIASFSYRIFTDGSYKDGKCGAGAALYNYKNELVDEILTHIDEGTNNIGELTAIYTGLRMFKAYSNRINEDIYDMAIEIMTDSQYCKSLLTAYYDTWSEKEKREAPNADIIKKIVDLMNDLRNDDEVKIVITHINSHQKSNDPDSDISHNNYVDVLADRAACQ